MRRRKETQDGQNGFQQGRRRVATEGVPVGYVEDCDEPRTMLGAVFTSLLEAEESHHAETDQQVIDGMSQNPRQQTPGFFV